MSTSVDSQHHDRDASVERHSQPEPHEVHDSPSDDRDYRHQYRSVSRLAVMAVVLTLFSLVAFTAPLLAIVLSGTSLTLGLIARSSIRKYPDELVGLLPAKLAIFGSLFIMVGSISLHLFILATEVPEGYTRISFGDLQNNDRRSRQVVSNRALELDGEQVFLKGYVYPNDKKTNLKAFVLVRDRGTCCFGGQPKLTDMVFVKLEENLRINYSWRLRKLGGIFSIDKENLKVGQINSGFYRLNADYLK